MSLGDLENRTQKGASDAGLEKLKRILRSNIAKNTKINILLVLLIDVYFKLYKNEIGVCEQ